MNHVMRQQLHETQALKAHRSEQQRREDEAIARRNAQVNAEMERFEREQLQAAKKQYDAELNQQYYQEQERKVQEREERRYDPNLYKVIEDQNNLVTQVTQCADCDVTLGKQVVIKPH